MAPQLSYRLPHKALLFFAALLVVPLIYFSGLRLVGQFMVPTDTSSLWEAPLQPPAEISRSLLATLSRLDPLTPDYPFLLANLVSGEDPVEALRLNRKAVLLSVLSPRHWIQRGWLEAQGGNIGDALRSFERALFLDPRDVDSHVQKGLFLFFHVAPYGGPQRKASYLTMAEESLSLAAQYDPSLLRSPPVAFALASIYNEAGDQDKARTTLQQADDRAPQDLRFLVKKWALFFQLGDTKRPLSQWELLFREENLAPAQLDMLADEMGQHNIPDFKYFEAKIHLLKGETNSALQKLNSCVSERPHVAEYRITLGDVYEKLGKPATALAQYEKALQISPANQYAKSKVIEYYSQRRGVQDER